MRGSTIPRPEKRDRKVEDLEDRLVRRYVLLETNAHVVGVDEAGVFAACAGHVLGQGLDLLRAKNSSADEITLLVVEGHLPLGQHAGRC